MHIMLIALHFVLFSIENAGAKWHWFTFLVLSGLLMNNNCLIRALYNSHRIRLENVRFFSPWKWWNVYVGYDRFKVSLKFVVKPEFLEILSVVLFVNKNDIIFVLKKWMTLKRNCKHSIKIFYQVYISNNGNMFLHFTKIVFFRRCQKYMTGNKTK